MRMVAIFAIEGFRNKEYKNNMGRRRVPDMTVSSVRRFRGLMMAMVLGHCRKESS
jgi:hypothetical protein